jgi:hypothetical protein
MEGTYILLGMPGHRELRVLSGIQDMGLGNIKILCTSERLNGGVLHALSVRYPRQRAGGAYMVRALQRSMELRAHLPFSIRIDLQQDAKQC